MRWAHAKAYLIAAFILLDSFLGYQLWTQRQQQGSGYPLTMPSSQRQEALEQLDRANIAVDIEFPAVPEPMEWLVVSRPNEPVANLIARFFPGETPDVRHVDSNLGSRTYLLGRHSELTVFENGRLEFRRYGLVPSPGDPQVDETRARGAAQDFLKDYGGLPADAAGETVQFDRSTGIYHVVWYQLYQGRAHFGARLEVLLTRDGQAYMIQEIWPQPAGLEGPKKALLPATDAVLRLAGSLVRQPADERIHIVAISLGYYSQAYNSDRWVEPPVWRILLGDGSVYHVNAYTGQLEP